VYDKQTDGHVCRRLGRTGLEVSEISLGLWTLGGPNWDEGQPVGWADVDEAGAVAAVERGLELGCNHFDTADVYGNGLSEQRLGRVLGSRRKDVVVASKVGWFRGTAQHYFQPLHIRHQLEQSLSNLRTDYLDIYYFHHTDFGPWRDEAVEVMHRLKEEGKIRFIGQSGYEADALCEMIEVLDPDVIQSRAHIMDTRMIGAGSRLARMMAERDIGFVAFSPMAQGLLLNKFSPDNPPSFGAGDNRSGSRWFSAGFLARLAPVMNRVEARFGGGMENLLRVCLQYLLAHPAVSCVIPGFRNVKQVELDLSPAGKPLSQDDVSWIREQFKDLIMD
jgi:aryl-alcohol dehydrogenase-like predicted oxidoreductase